VLRGRLFEIKRERGDGYETYRFELRVPEVVTEEAREHLRSAARELLLAARSALDDLVRRLEKKE